MAETPELTPEQWELMGQKMELTRFLMEAAGGTREDLIRLVDLVEEKRKTDGLTPPKS